MKTLLEAILLVGMAAGILMMLFFYRDLKEELYRWSDRSAANLADSIGARTREQLKYFDYLNLDKMLAEQMNLDDLLLYGAVEYGKDLGQKMEAGDESAGPSRVYVREIREGGITAARVTIHYSTSVIRRKLIALQWTMATGALITMAAFLGCIWLPLSHNVRKPLRRLAAHASAMASGDFSSEISVGSSGEESGQLAAALGRMAYHLREMVGKIRTIFTGLEKASVDIAGVAHAISVSSREQAESVSEVSASIMEMNSSIKSVAASVGSLHSISEGSFSSIQEMTASVEQVAGVSEQLSTAVEQTASSITQMSFSIQSVAANVETLSGLVTGLSSSLNEMDHSLKEVDQSAKEANRLSERVVQTVSLEGHEAVGKAMEGINAIQISVAEASRVIALLGKRSQDIGEIINVIKDVNEQTNLLALNAAIIAAQAGEHGRGFAVVASEIRELSARTSAATSEITGLITGVQDQAGKAVGAMEDGSRSVENGIRLIREVSIALKKAAENSEKASAASKVIARATTQQTESIRQLSGSASNMSQMSREMARATQEQSVGVAQVMHAAEEIRDLAFRVKKATTEQAAGIKQISLATEKSAVMAQEINRATREEAKGSELIVKSAGKIRDTASANLEVANRLEEMMSNLTEQANLLKRELDGFITEKGQDRKRI